MCPPQINFGVQLTHPAVLEDGSVRSQLRIKAQFAAEPPPLRCRRTAAEDSRPPRRTV